MRLELLVARTSLLRRPARVLFSVLGVALGIAAVVSIFTVDHNTILHLQPQLATEGDFAADLVVRPAEGQGDPTDLLLEQEGILAATRVLRADVELRADDVAVPARLVALDLAPAERMGVLRVEIGALPDPSRPGVLVGEVLAERLGLAVGDEVLVAAAPVRPAPVCEDGRLVAPPDASAPEPSVALRVDGLLANERIGRAAGGAVVCLDQELARRLFADNLAPLELWAARSQAVDLERLQQDLVREGLRFDLRAGAVVGQEADERAFRNGVRLSGLMTLALGLYVIFHTLSMSLTERLRDVGVLHALGASRLQVARCFFTEAVLVACAAGVVGILGGLGLARLMLEAGITSLGISKSVRGNFDVPWSQVLTLGCVGVGIALAGSVYPLVKAGSTDAVLALRGEPSRDERHERRFHLVAALLLAAVLPAVFLSVVGLVGEGSRELLRVVFLGTGVLLLLVATPLLVPGVVAFAATFVARLARRALPFVGLLAARSMTGGRTRVAACVSALALVSAAFVGLRGITGSLRAETVQWADAALANKVWLGGLPDVALADLRRALDHPQVLGFEVADVRVDVGFRVQGLGPDAAGYGPLAARPELASEFFAGRGALISERLAVQQGLLVGGALVPGASLVLARPSGPPVTYPVLAVHDGYGYFRDPHERAFAVIAAAAVERDYCVGTERARSVAVRLADGADPFLVEALVAPLMASGAAPSLVRGGEIRYREELDVRRDFLVFHVILALAAALAGLGLLNAQLLATSERVKELGVLRALGASHGQIAGSVLLESAAVGLVGGTFGLALGLLVTPTVVTALRVLSGLDLPHPPFDPALVAVPPLAVALALAAAVYPVWRLRAASPAHAVRTG
jgi:putative ABC transport system permease protein